MFQLAAKKAPEKYYQISENQLGYVLSSFAAQSGIAFSYDANILKGLKSKGITGHYSVKQGFDYLLADHPLSGRAARFDICLNR